MDKQRYERDWYERETDVINVRKNLATKRIKKSTN